MFKLEYTLETNSFKLYRVFKVTFIQICSLKKYMQYEFQYQISIKHFENTFFFLFTLQWFINHIFTVFQQFICTKSHACHTSESHVRLSGLLKDTSAVKDGNQTTNIIRKSPFTWAKVIARKPISKHLVDGFYFCVHL